MRRHPLLSLLVGLLTAALLQVSTASAAPTDRLAGPDRYATAVEISRSVFPETNTRVYLARASEPLVDALAGGVLRNGPILLVPACGRVPSSVMKEIARLDAGKVIALGGPGAICDQVLADASVGREPGRLSGDSRYTTAVKISEFAFRDGAPVAYLARAFPPLVDALAGGALRDGPILLVPGCGEVPFDVLLEIERLDPTRVVALGGKSAVCPQVLNDAGAGRTVERIAGPDRFSTATEISKVVFPDGAGTVHLARAVDPLVDALAGGVLVDGPVLLVPGCGDLPEPVRDEILRLQPDNIIALGGDTAICQDLLDEAGAVGDEPTR